MIGHLLSLNNFLAFYQFGVSSQRKMNKQKFREDVACPTSVSHVTISVKLEFDYSINKSSSGTALLKGKTDFYRSWLLSRDSATNHNKNRRLCLRYQPALVIHQPTSDKPAFLPFPIFSQNRFAHLFSITQITNHHQLSGVREFCKEIF